MNSENQENLFLMVLPSMVFRPHSQIVFNQSFVQSLALNQIIL